MSRLKTKLGQQCLIQTTQRLIMVQKLRLKVELSTVDQFSEKSSLVVLALDEKQILKGLMEVLVSMKVGGKTRALIPPSAGYINEYLQPVPEEFGPQRSLLSHANEPLVFEMQLLKEL